MAVGMLMMLPGVTKEQYQQLTEKMFGSYPMDSSKAPEGLVVHSAGPDETGWYVYDIWESKEAFQRFAQEQMRPAVEAAGFGQQLSGSEPQFFEVDNIVQAR